MPKYYHFSSISSTSTYLKENYKDYDNLTYISADFQENGHGRYGRKWVSKSNENLLFSILITDREVIDKYASLSLASALCIVRVLEKLNIKNVSIKWPNDVLVNDKKIAGILLESISFNQVIEALIIGVGINVNSKEFNDTLLNTPTSIFLETNNIISFDNFKNLIYLEFNKMIDEIKSRNTNYLKSIKKYNYLKNKQVYAKINGERVLVKVIDINDDNSLKVEIDEKIHNIYSGEITFHL